MVALLILWQCAPYLGKGPFWNNIFTYTSITQCYKYWWTNLLYINNFYPTNYDDTCMAWTWYLATDMQLYILTPIFIFMYWKSKMGGWILLIVSTLLSLAANFGIVHYYGFTPYVPAMQVDDRYESFVYSKFYTRAVAWFVGIGAAWWLLWHEKQKDKRINWIVQLICFIIAGFLMGSAVFGTQSLYQEQGGWTKSEKDTYLTFAHIGFTFGVALMMHMCFTGNGYIINTILSFSAWDILARLTYSTYLYHPIIITIIFFGYTEMFDYSVQTMLVHFLAFTVLGFTAAAISFLLVERPMMNLEKLFLPAPREHKEQHKSNGK